MTAFLKQRTALRRLFALTIPTGREKRSDLLHAFDALRAKRLLDNTTIFHHLNLLKIRSELTPSRFHREASSISKLSRLPTTFALSHIRRILSYLRGVIICKRRSYHSKVDLSMREPESGDDLYDW